MRRIWTRKGVRSFARYVYGSLGLLPSFLGFVVERLSSWNAEVVLLLRRRQARSGECVVGATIFPSVQAVRLATKTDLVRNE